jgi:hypothetical protein
LYSPLIPSATGSYPVAVRRRITAVAPTRSTLTPVNMHVQS